MNRQIVLGTLLSVVCAAFAAAAGAQEGDPKAGELKATTCLGCHGVPGYSNVYPSYHVPRVGGQHAQYIIAALNAYKNGDRSHKTMQAQAATLSDQDIADIAAYFAAEKSD
jgi:cytochrome c553